MDVNRLLYVGLVTFIIAPTCLAQVFNKGGLYILPETEMAVVGAFNNKASGQTFNNGTVFFYDDFLNDGVFDFRSDLLSKGQVVFRAERQQHIGGEKAGFFNDVLFDNGSKNTAFEVSTDVNFAGKVLFKKGIAGTLSDDQTFTFLSQALAIGASDVSYLQGMVEKVGNTEFVFPTGDRGFYRKARIDKAKEITDVFVTKYMFEDADFYRNKDKKTAEIEVLGDTEYWLVERGKNTKESVILSLSWDERTTAHSLLDVKTKGDLCIVRWDELLGQWVNEGGVVNLDRQEVSTPVEVSGYGYFTLAKVREQSSSSKGDVKVYNLVTPNGDGMNDYFFIENINRFPNNSVEIFNRWGTRVYDTKNYDSNGNVFTGISGGRSAVGGNKKLPSGTYYYILTYEVPSEIGMYKVKKSGYLHLESY